MSQAAQQPFDLEEQDDPEWALQPFSKRDFKMVMEKCKLLRVYLRKAVFTCSLERHIDRVFAWIAADDPRWKLVKHAQNAIVSKRRLVISLVSVTLKREELQKAVRSLFFECLAECGIELEEILKESQPSPDVQKETTAEWTWTGPIPYTRHGCKRKIKELEKEIELC